MSRRLATPVAILLATMIATGSPTPAGAGTTTPDHTGTPTAGTTVDATDMLTALRRDLGLTPDQADARLATATAAARAERDLRATLGAEFAGSWLDGRGDRVVAVTTPAALDTARQSGTRVRLVPYAEATLVAAAARLDRAAGHAPGAVSGWYVDVVGNAVVVQTAPGGVAAATAFAGTAGVSPGIVRVVESAERPRTLADVRGGDPFLTAQSMRCSVGFTVRGGFLTAGHCGQAGDPAYAPNGQVMGVFASSSFPGNDYAWVRLNPGWTPRGEIRTGGSTAAPIRGSVEAPIGASVCRYGSTTGWRCGIVQARNQTLNFASGQVVSGLTRTTVCAEPGDSAGPFVSGDQAQGLLVAGTGNCTAGGSTFFQPVNEPLAALGLTLLTSP
ncbi:S1 family peptidase [Micromonospora sp. NBC_01699]|uniref:S1 family peptidase n=1 Tax=Micromonospora sp. NBC_01699 TaxID=2975984 RepID=UPI002E2F95E9|nr:S1 family peptidase [Micromonospora sp. NBC_01699]